MKLYPGLIDTRWLLFTSWVSDRAVAGWPRPTAGPTRRKFKGLSYIAVVSRKTLCQICFVNAWRYVA
eukprot:5150774-Lingulodinium_polyedra.AAC.1